MKKYGRITMDELIAGRKAIRPNAKPGGPVSISRLQIPPERDPALIRRNYAGDKLYRTDATLDYVFDKLLGALHPKLLAFDFATDELLLRDELLEQAKGEHNLLVFGDYREILFGALDVYEKNVLRGRVSESAEERAAINQWYADMCGKDMGAVKRVPAKVLKYADKEADFEIL
jgi:hypothetical protein